MSLIDLDIYSIHEKRHLLDVKRVLKVTYQLWMILLVLSSIISIFFRNSYRIFFRRVSILGLSICFILLVSSISFIDSFNFLHTLLFNNQTWIFPNNSMLIELFPLVYFQQFFFFFLIGNIILFISLLFLNNPRHPKTTS